MLFLWISLCISRQLRNPVCRLLLIAGRREDTDGTKILKCFHSWSKELLNEKNEIEENAELDCLRDYQGLIKAQDGFIEPQFPI